MDIKQQKKDYIEWKAPEYEHFEKTPDWFWSVGILTIALIFTAVILKNFLFALFSLLAGFSIALLGARKPSVIKFRITPRGIWVGDKIYHYEELDCFWIDEDSPNKKLIIESKKKFIPQITILLNNTDPNAVRNFLKKYLKEERIEEPLINIISRILKF